MRDYRRYDQCVDVVSIFEMLYTQSETLLPGTVVHFERYPYVEGYTPDFTVVFSDGTGLVGEIANVPRNDEGRDAICAQLANYDRLAALPINPAGVLQSVDHVDVLFLTPLADAREVAGHILERAADPNHDYAPSHPPCIVGYTLEQRDSGLSYLLMDTGHPGNGRLREAGRSDGIGNWLEVSGSIKAPPWKFEDIKASAVFMNDLPRPLYMATALWARVLPTLAPRRPRQPEPIDISEDQLAELLHARYGITAKSSIRGALEMLEKASYAQRLSPDGDWRIAWEQPQAGGSDNLAQQFAEKFCKPPKRGAVHRLPKPEGDVEAKPEQLRFDA